MTACVADDHPEVALAINGEELESVYGCARLRKEVTTHKLKPQQIKLEEFKLGTCVLCPGAAQLFSDAQRYVARSD